MCFVGFHDIWNSSSIYSKRITEQCHILQLQIETEGNTLVNNVQRTITRNLEINERVANRWIQRQQRHLETLTKRWYQLWIRSLSVQCRIEHQLDHLYSVCFI
ncbi:hypothetical protein LOAG_12988 [Loa loa]|uniref:Uncharacterized protein n=1 Tax=Loa loa TaxID=7209 RepID=A0A1S0TK86_LOALO|nr:hypothetical protein LOAG_12988 [Loa loa]EFO15522.1 hypothetical protein LOAG_12988 [Loa loa]